MLHLLRAHLDPLNRAALRDALTAHLQAVAAHAARGDRTLVARAEAEVRPDPAAHIGFDDTGLATLRAAGRTFQAGRFEAVRIGELRRKAAEAQRAAGEPAARLRLCVLDGGSPATDIGALQATAPPDSLFQVASQFNCLESPGAYVTDVASYFHDPTQGPRASISAFPGTLVRHYAAALPGGARFVQQTDGPQLNLLEDVCTPGVALVRNGYLTTANIARLAVLAQALEERLDDLRVGVHDAVEVVFGHNWDGPVPGAPHHTIAQVFSSTVAAGGYSRLDAADPAISAVVRGLQRAAHLGTLLAAAALGKSYVVLTLVGGGVFGNPVAVIWESMLWAMDVVRPLLHRDLLVVVNGRNMGEPVPAATLREEAEARGGVLVAFDRLGVHARGLTMPSPTDRDVLDVAWSSWRDRSAAPPAELHTLVEKLCDAADRDARAASFGAARAEAIAWQMELAIAFQRLRSAASGQHRRAGFTSWQALATLARAADGEARAELIGLAIEAGGGAGSLVPACLAELAPLLDPATTRAWALEALSTGDLDTGDQGLLLGVLPEEDMAVLLPPRLERAAAIEDSDERWSALLDLVGELPKQWERRAGEESRARHSVELRWFPDGVSEEALEQAEADAERKRWGAPFTAWRLGEEASGLPAGERRPTLDRAIDEFAAIALTPVNPENDEGPFWAMARMLDEPQVRRALAVVDRMEGADWKGDLGASRASLIARLALLGHADEAERMIPRIGTADPFAATWRARAWGGVLGARLALDPAARFEELLVTTAGEPVHDDPEWRFRVLEATAHVFADRAPPDAANVEALVGLARLFDPRLRQISLVDLIARFVGSLPVQRWIDLVLPECEGQGCIEALICLAEALRDAGLDPVPALRPLLATLDEQPCAEPIWTFPDLCGLRISRPRTPSPRGPSSSVTPTTAARCSPSRMSRPSCPRCLAGPEAALEAGRALARPRGGAVRVKARAHDARSKGLSSRDALDLDRDPRPTSSASSAKRLTPGSRRAFAVP